MDGPNKNLKYFEKLFQPIQRGYFFYSLIDTGSYGLHIIHRSFQEN